MSPQDVVRMTTDQEEPLGFISHPMFIREALMPHGSTVIDMSSFN